MSIHTRDWHCLLYISSLALCLCLLSWGASATAMDDCWTSISGPVDYRLTPAHGEQGVLDPASHPGIREKTVTWTTPDGSFYLFGGTSLEAVTFAEVAHNDLWRFNPADDSWCWVSGSALGNQYGDYSLDGDNRQTPGARNFAVGWTGGEGALYLFGGLGFASSGSQGMLNDLWRYDIASGEWTWLKGSEVINQPGQYGEWGESDAANTPGARYGSMAWTGADGKLYLFGGYSLGKVGEIGYLNDLWVYDPGSAEWTWLKGVSAGNDPGFYGGLGVADDANLPAGRAYGTTWTGGDGACYLFGGARYVSATEGGSLGDLWRYEPASNQWTWIKGGPGLSDPGVYGQQGVAEAANNPPSRSYATAWVGPSGGLYLFGGLFYDAVSRTFGHKNDLWRYEPSSGQWIWLHGGQGVNEAGIYGEKGVFDAANTPGARSYGAVWTDGDGQALLYGGHGYRTWTHSELISDFWQYDPAVNQWMWFDGVNPQMQNGLFASGEAPDPAAIPSARRSNGCWATPDGDFYLFGGRGLDGYGGNGSLNDLWRYRTATGQWVWIKGDMARNAYGVYGQRGVADPANNPGARDQVAACADTAGKGYVFGGQGLDAVGSGGRLCDLWRYDPAANAWTWLAGGDSVNAYGIYGDLGAANAANRPGGRRNAAIWWGADGRLYLFGGDGYAESAGLGSLNDLWRYDPASGLWTWLGGGRLVNQAGSYGVKGASAEGNIPGSRSAMMTWTGPEGDLYLYGGNGYDSLGNPGELGDLWRYDPAGNQWTWLQGSDLRRSFAAYGTPGVAGAANTPGCRTQGSAWTGADGQFYLFGGFSRTTGDTSANPYNDLWRYNPVTNRWAWIGGNAISRQPGIYGDQGIAHPSNTPGARYGAMAWTGADGRAYLFGGYGYDAGANLNELNDFWLFEPGRLAAAGWAGYR